MPESAREQPKDLRTTRNPKEGWLSCATLHLHFYASILSVVPSAWSAPCVLCKMAGTWSPWAELPKELFLRSGRRSVPEAPSRCLNVSQAVIGLRSYFQANQLVKMEPACRCWNPPPLLPPSKHRDMQRTDTWRNLRFVGKIARKGWQKSHQMYCSPLGNAPLLEIIFGANRKYTGIKDHHVLKHQQWTFIVIGKNDRIWTK